MRRVLAAVAAAVAAGIIGRQATHRWGATPAEHAAALPGDDLVADPAIVATRAVSVDADPATVWAWLVQIGQNRGGMYSYDWLETSSACRSTVRTRSAKTGSTSRSATVSCWSRQASPA
jgi:hypothetical protein